MSNTGDRFKNLRNLVIFHKEIPVQKKPDSPFWTSSAVLEGLLDQFNASQKDNAATEAALSQLRAKIAGEKEAIGKSYQARLQAICDNQNHLPCSLLEYFRTEAPAVECPVEAKTLYQQLSLACESRRQFLDTVMLKDAEETSITRGAVNIRAIGSAGQINLCIPKEGESAVNADDDQTMEVLACILIELLEKYPNGYICIQDESIGPTLLKHLYARRSLLEEHAVHNFSTFNIRNSANQPLYPDSEAAEQQFQFLRSSLTP